MEFLYIAIAFFFDFRPPLTIILVVRFFKFLFSGKSERPSNENIRHVNPAKSAPVTRKADRAIAYLFDDNLDNVEKRVLALKSEEAKETQRIQKRKADLERLMLVIKKFKHEKLELERAILSGSYSKSILQISEILDHEKLPKVEHHIVKMTVGGKLYYLALNKRVESALKGLVATAKGGSVDHLSTDLRKFGYQYEFEEIKRLDNEVSTLLELHILEKKNEVPTYRIYTPDNSQFQITKTINDFGEEVLAVHPTDQLTNHNLLEDCISRISEAETRKEELQSEIEEQSANLAYWLQTQHQPIISIIMKISCFLKTK